MYRNTIPIKCSRPRQPQRTATARRRPPLQHRGQRRRARTPTRRRLSKRKKGGSTGSAVLIGLLSFGAGMAVGAAINSNNYYYPAWGYGGVWYGPRPYYPPPYRPVYYGGWHGGYNYNRPVHYGNNNIYINNNNYY